MSQPKYSIRPLSWRLSAELDALTPTFQVLELPDTWKQIFLRLEEDQQRKDGKFKEGTTAYVPHQGLHSALTALVGDLLIIESGVWNPKSNSKEWLYAETKISPEAIYEIVWRWASIHWKGHEDLQKLSASYLNWKPLTPNLADWGQAENGTAKPSSPYAFRLLPHYIAGQLSRKNVHLQIGDAHRELRRCPSSSGAELMTWPPEAYTVKGRSAYYCVVLNFSVQTVPFQNFPAIHCEIGVRRWKVPKAKYVAGDTNVYLLTDVPWLKSLNQSQSFQIAPISWSRDDSGKFKAVWSKNSYLVELLNNLNSGRPFPDASELFSSTEEYFDTSGAHFAGIVHSTRMGSHPVGAGIFPIDLRLIGEQINELLAPLSLVWTDAPQRLKEPSGFSVSKNIFAQAVQTSNRIKEKAAEIQQHRRDNLPIDANDELHLELFYQNESMRRAFENELRKFFGINSDQQFPIPLASGSCLHFKVHKFGELGGELMSQKSRTAYEKRVREIERYFEQRGEKSPLYAKLSFVELGDKEYFRKKPDPKDAIRAGFAACGRLTQFIALQENELPNDEPWPIAEGALLDGMRQLGLGALLPDLSKLNLSGPLQIMGFWMSKNLRDSSEKSIGTLPLWLKINSESGLMQIKAMGWDEWLPLRQAQLALANPHNQQSRPTFNKREILAFIDDTVRHNINGNTALFCDAQNSRSFWSWLQNGNITKDSLNFLHLSHAEPLGSCANWNGLRIIRVRDHEIGEIPQHFSPNDDGVSAPSGVYAFEDTRIFGSINPKPPQFLNLNLSMSRFEKAANKNSWNSRLLEITLAGLQPDDDPHMWVFFAHRLRESAAHYRAHTSLPLPLHLLQKLEEYVLPF